jgi:lipid A disaccharide synthetase
LYSNTTTKKNIAHIVEFAEKNPKLQFIVVGGSQSSFKKSKIKQLDNLKFVGTIEDKEKNILLKESKALLYTSKYEGFGLPIYEALVNKTPVICYKVKPFTQLFANIKLNYIEDLKDFKIPKKLLTPYKPYRFSLKKSGRSLSKILEKRIK